MASNGFWKPLHRFQTPSNRKKCAERACMRIHTRKHTHTLTHTHTHTQTDRLLNCLCRTGVRVLHVGTFTGAFCILARKLSTPGACPMRMFSSFTPCAHARFKLTPCPYDCLIEIFHVFYQCTCACCILCTKPSTCCAWAIRICSSCTPCDFIQSSAALAWRYLVTCSSSLLTIPVRAACWTRSLRLPEGVHGQLHGNKSGTEVHGGSLAPGAHTKYGKPEAVVLSRGESERTPVLRRCGLAVR